MPNFIAKFLTLLLIIAALLFMASTIFNPSSRFFITLDGWKSLWIWITGQGA